MLLLEGNLAIFKTDNQSLSQKFFPSIRGAYDKVPLCIPDWNRERTPFPDEIHIDADDGAMMIVTGDLLLEITRAEMIEP